MCMCLQPEFSSDEQHDSDEAEAEEVEGEEAEQEEGEEEQVQEEEEEEEPEEKQKPVKGKKAKPKAVPETVVGTTAAGATTVKVTMLPMSRLSAVPCRFACDVWCDVWLWLWLWLCAWMCVWMWALGRADRGNQEPNMDMHIPVAWYGMAWHHITAHAHISSPSTGACSTFAYLCCWLWCCRNSSQCCEWIRVIVCGCIYMESNKRERA